MSLTLTLGACASRPAIPRAVDGVLDLRAWDLAADGPVRLDGDWDIYPGRLLSAQELDDPEIAATSGRIHVPGAWNARSYADGPMQAEGVATYALELFRGAPSLDRVYVPIGLGSGICGTITVRDALGLDTEIVGVVADGAPAYAESFVAGRMITSARLPDTIADGVACRVPNENALKTILSGVSRIVSVSEPDIRAAMRHYLTDCHQLAEGAAALPLAAALMTGERERNRDARIALIHSGGNVDTETLVSAVGPDR